MSGLKMSSVFNLPLYVHDGAIMCQGVVKNSQPHPEVMMKAVCYSGDEVLLSYAVANAINSYDNHAEQVAKLTRDVDLLRKALMWMKADYVSSIDSPYSQLDYDDEMMEAVTKALTATGTKGMII